MIAFADTNWLVAAYFVNDRTPVVRRFATKNDWPWHLSPPVLLECEAVFPRLAKAAAPPQLKSLQAHLGSKLMAHSFPWDDLQTRASNLLAQYAHKAEIGVFDAMILSAAAAAGADWFLCFDTGSNARALAAVLRMHVFPDLTNEDSKRMATLRRGR
jgi:predicted nucleic acid-binding protein